MSPSLGARGRLWYVIEVFCSSNLLLSVSWVSAKGPKQGKSVSNFYSLTKGTFRERIRHKIWNVFIQSYVNDGHQEEDT